MLQAIAAGVGIAAPIVQGFLSDYAQNRANKASASALKQQAGIYGAQAEASLRTATMYAKQAGMNVALGKGNARNLRLAAANLDPYEQYALRNARVEARRRVGEGRTQFAANGVLVDTGAAALWEQDEAADAALERLDIMQQFEDQSWEYRTQANKALSEGYAAAAANAGAAMGAAGDAYAARLQQSAALAQAKQKKKKSWYNTIGAVVGTLGGAALGIAGSKFGGGSSAGTGSSAVAIH